MSDPIKEAANNAWGSQPDDGPTQQSHYRTALAGARAALKPLRDLHTPRDLTRPVFNGDGTFIAMRVESKVCSHCYSGPHESMHCEDCDSTVCEGTVCLPTSSKWPCATARLIYSTEELA